MRAFDARGRYRYSQRRTDERARQVVKTTRTMRKLDRGVVRLWRWFTRRVLKIKPWQPSSADARKYRTVEE